MFGTSEATVFSSLAPHHDELFVSRVVSLAGFGLSMLALSLFGERVRKNADRFPMRKVFVAIGAAGMLAGSLVGLGLLPLTFLYAGSLFRGVYCAAIAVMWVDLFTKLDWKTIGASVSAALVVYAVAGLAIGAAAQLSATLAAIILVACPVLSYWGYRRAGLLIEVPNIKQKDMAVPLPTRAMLYVANLLYGVMLGIILHYFAMSDTLAAVTAFLLMSFVMLCVFLHPSNALGLHFAYRAFMMVVAVSIPVIVLMKWSGFVVASIVTSAILAVMIFYTVVIFSDTQARLSGPFWKVPGMCQLFAAVGMIASSAAFHFLLSGDASSSDLMLVSAACVIFVASVFAPNDRSQVRPWGFSSLVPSESPEIKRLRRCGEIANEFRLTSRELEILQQLASGSTKEEVAEALVISPLTAKTHIHNIYSKLSIHSQKELQQLIEE